MTQHIAVNFGIVGSALRLTQPTFFLVAREWETMSNQSGDLDFHLIQLVPMLVLSLGIMLVAYKLAKEKDRNVVLWTILGAIPILNIVCVWFFIGAANRRLERKLDDLSRRIGGAT
jgi:hypothetical protein